MTKAKLWHGFLMVGGTLAVLAPDLTSLAATLSGLGVGWLAWVARILGIAALIGSRWDKIRAKVAPLLGPPSSGTPVVAFLALGTALLFSGTAHAEGKACRNPDGDIVPCTWTAEPCGDRCRRDECRARGCTWEWWAFCYSSVPAQCGGCLCGKDVPK